MRKLLPNSMHETNPGALLTQVHKGETERSVLLQYVHTHPPKHIWNMYRQTRNSHKRCRAISTWVVSKYRPKKINGTTNKRPQIFSEIKATMDA